jgi:hypothetical protein
VAGTYTLSNSSPSVSNWVIQGFEITTANRSNIYLGLVNYNGNRLVLDRNYMHSLDTGIYTTCEYGIVYSGTNSIVTDSWLAYFPQAFQSNNSTSALVAILVGECDGLTVHNTFLGADFANLLLGGSSFSTPNSATLSGSPSTTSATFSNVSNLAVGDLVSLKEANPKTVTDAVISGTSVTSQTANFTRADRGLFRLDFPGLGFGQIAIVTVNSSTNVTVNTNLGSHTGATMFVPGEYGSVKVDSIVGSVVTYHAVGVNSDLRIAPMVPGDVQWNGRLPKNITLTHNTFFIDPVIAAASHAATGSSNKGFWEAKAVDTILVDGNEFTGVQSSVAFFPVNQGTPLGCPSVWSRTWNITFTNNWYHTVSGPYQVFSFLGNNDYYCTSLGTKNVVYRNNLVTSGGIMNLVGGGDNVSITHNTGITYGGGDRALDSLSGFNTNFTYKDNIVKRGNYGLHCQENGGSTTGLGCFPSGVIQNNVFIDPNSGQEYCGVSFDSTNHCTGVIATVKFINAGANNYRLASDSPYKGKASDGKDPGVDMDQLLAALGGSVATPTPRQQSRLRSIR